MALKQIERKISWDIYITAFIISLVIFGIGIWFGLQIEKSASEQINERMGIISNNLISIGNILLLENDRGYCDYIKNKMKEFDSETYNLGREIEYMEENKGGAEALKLNYMELEFRDYLLTKKIKQMCGEEQNIVIYLVSSKDCTICKEQGEILTSARTKTNTRVYTFDLNINSTLTEMLRNKYNVSIFPTLIINENKYTGKMTEAELLSKLQ